MSGNKAEPFGRLPMDVDNSPDDGSDNTAQVISALTIQTLELGGYFAKHGKCPLRHLFSTSPAAKPLSINSAVHYHSLEDLEEQCQPNLRLFRYH